MLKLLLEHRGLFIIAERIISFLDDSSIKNCRLVKSTWRSTIQNQKKWWTLLLNCLRRKKIIFHVKCRQVNSDIQTKKLFPCTLEKAFPEYKEIIDNILANEKLETCRKMFRVMYPYFLLSEVSSELMCPLLYASMTCHQGSMLNLLDCMWGASGPLNPSRIIKFTCAHGSISLVQHVFTYTLRGIERNFYFEDNYNLYHLAIKNEDPRVLKYIIETIGQEGIDAKNNYGMTPLLQACFEGSIQAVKFLIEYAKDLSIDLNARSNKGNNIFQLAVQNIKSPQMLQNLIETLEVRNSVNLEFGSHEETGETILHIACRIGSKETVEYLLLNSEKHKIDLNARDNEGDSAILTAVWANREQIVGLFFDPRIANKIRYNRVNGVGRNILHMACLKQSSKPAIMRLLLNHSDQFTFSLRGKDSYGSNPLHYACRNGNGQMVKLILSTFKKPRALLTMRNHDNNRPGDLARMHGHRSLESVLNRY